MRALKRFLIGCSLFLFLIPGAYPSPSPREALEAYYGALRDRDYRKAFSLLSRESQEHYANVENFISTFAVPSFSISAFKVQVLRQKERNALGKVICHFSLRDFRSDRNPAGAQPVPTQGIRAFSRDLVWQDGWRIVSLDGAWRSVAGGEEGKRGGLLVRLLALDFYPGKVVPLMEFSNARSHGIRVLPYFQSALLDGRKRKFLPLLPGADPSLLKGRVIPPHEKIVGYLQFEVPGLSAKQQPVRQNAGQSPLLQFPLEIVIGGCYEEEGDSVFAVTISGVRQK